MGFVPINVQVNMVPGPMWSGDLVLSAFQVHKGEVVNRTTTDPVITSSDELAEGVSIEELFQGSEWVPVSEWVLPYPFGKWYPESHWGPRDHYTPSEIEDVAMAENDLGENQTMVVVYAYAAGDSGREVTTQPYGVILSLSSRKV